MVKVIEVDREHNRLILSERAASKEARQAQKERLLNSIELGQVLEGTVTSIKDFGAFVDLGGADGMVHLTELAHGRVKHPSEVVKEGDRVTVKVIELDREAGRIALSMKALVLTPGRTLRRATSLVSSSKLRWSAFIRATASSSA